MSNRADNVGAGIGCLAVALPFLLWAGVWGGVIYAAVHFIRKFW